MKWELTSYIGLGDTGLFFLVGMVTELTAPPGRLIISIIITW